ncbi:unnamed protein product [Closterium sp. Naga37s-1]|nr:unnamed protein product [Closterium sp. Naga37s-1]
MINGAAHSAPKAAEALPLTYHPVTTSLNSLPQLTPQDKLFLAARCFVVTLGLLLVTFHFFKDSATWHSPIEWLAADFRPFDANISGSVYQEGFAAVSIPADSPPAVALPAESAPAVSLPVDSPPAVSLPVDSPPAVSLPADSPPAKPPPEGDGALVAFDRAFAALISLQRKARFSLANVATFHLDPSVTSASIATRYKLLSLPVPRVPENLTWSDVYPANRTWLPVVLLSSCRPPPNLFHCSRLVTREGDTWLYNLTASDMLTRVQPLGSCSMAQPINSKVAANQRVAYATVLHSSDRYVCGAIVLGQSIRRTGSTHEMVVLVSKEIQEESRRGLKEAGWTVKEIERIRNPHALNGTYNEWNYSKLRLWQQTEYTKLLFIDSDLLLLTSVDFLFSYPEISARGNDGTDFNSGVMVLEPSDCMFDLLMANLERVRSENGGDQVRPCCYVM